MKSKDEIERSRFISGKDAESVSLTCTTGGKQEIQHLFEAHHVDAINYAIACGRPLLLTGETGVGKTQLARAAAKALGRAYVRYTVDARTEPRDLLWQFDAISRLADAQIANVLGDSQEQIEEALKADQYLLPGPLWWGFDWVSAKALRLSEVPTDTDSGDPNQGVVVLIDEIDKAESDVPNGLLEALGDGHFQPAHRAQRVNTVGVPPLVILTSNGEKAFPDAFIRRCLVLDIQLKDDDDPALVEFLVSRGQVHVSLPPPVLEEAARQLIEDRKAARRKSWQTRPGMAEYIDLLNVLQHSLPDGSENQAYVDLLNRARPYLLRKSLAFAKT